MDSLDRYVFKTGFNLFLLVLCSLTAVIWVTQILRQIDLITGQGQTVLVFLGITSLIVPTLMLVLAPIAMLIAVVTTLTKLNNDSELVVISAAGVSPQRLFRPFLLLAVVVCLMVAFIAAWLSPFLQREMNERLAKVRADVVANIVRPGTFTSIERGLTFHIREKRSDSQFGGILIDDFRDPAERATILAEQGNILQTARGTYLVMTDGWVQRRRNADRDPTMVKFERYAFDLSPYTVAGRVSYGLRERYLWELLFPDADDKLLKSAPNQFQVELHDRLVAPLYPLAFVVIAFVLLCTPRSTRQGRMMSTVLVIAGVFGLRIMGFACMAIGQSSPGALYLLYPALLGSIGLGLFAIYTGRGLEYETAVDFRMIRDRLLARLSRPALR
ncbi:MAG: LPS export ABC transporter permease LptF [Rhodoplanes sp.]|uniref:LPS export ABC transporter permease LptF n=1 Tax=Rhodoplanes sp. TaxID=1968906 RepID=UPI00179FCF75|nr:LPS export ABC transporter permease LptF [Rhodoplanes sp.]NVO14987.1 LPS export ABC transporter permease LptF [Rhodoplanes sp.]